MSHSKAFPTSLVTALLLGAAAPAARSDSLHEMTIKHVDVACQIGGVGVEVSAQMTIAHAVIEGRSKVTSRTATLGGLPVQLSGSYDDASGALTVDSLYDKSRIKSLSVDPQHPDSASMLLQGTRVSLRGCTLRPSQLAIDMDKLKESELLAASDGAGQAAAEIRLVQRDYEGDQTLCYRRSPDFGLAFLAPKSKALPHLTAALRLAINTGAKWLDPDVDDVQVGTDVELSPYPTLWLVADGEPVAELHRCDEW